MSVECVVLDRSQAAVWIKRKHYKGMGGAGVVAWNAVATARSDATEGRYSRWMTALAYLEQHDVDAEEIRDLIAAKTTTVERVLVSTHISTLLGLSFEKNGTLTPENGDEAATVRLIHKLLEEMAERSFVETMVSNSDQQLSFIRRFASLGVKKPKAEGAGESSTSKSDIGGMGSGTGEGDGAASESGHHTTSPASASRGGVSSRPKSVKIRKVLAAPGLRISNSSLNKLYDELRKLNVEKNPHIAAAMIRVFLEKASTVFLETMEVPPLNPASGATWHDFGVKLKTKVKAVLKEIDPNGNNPKLVYARDVANGNKDKAHTSDYLNHAIHSHHALPAHTEIITIWDRYHQYFIDLFDAIEKQPEP